MDNSCHTTTLLKQWLARTKGPAAQMIETASFIFTIVDMAT